MAARPRKFNLGVENLYCRQDSRNGEVYYQYRDPRNGSFHGLGKDRELAKERATSLNLLIAQQMASSILETINSKPERKKISGIAFKLWAEKYMQIQQERLNSGDIRDNTYRSRKSQTKIIVESIGSILIKNITTKDCYELIQSIKAQGKERTAQAVRSLLIDMFKEAAQAGEIDGGFNPALATKAPKVKVYRSRLDVTHIEPILSASTAYEPWVKNSILLALVTGQRRIDIANMQFKKSADWNRAYESWKNGDRKNPPYSFVEDGWLHVFQQKTSTMLRLPLTLKLNAIDMTISDVVSQCRSNCVSKYMLHHLRGTQGATVGDPIHYDTISRRFADVRNDSGITWSGDAPTFHELRSLSERLYAEQGIDTQILLGHKDPRTTANYHDVRGQLWIDLVI